MRIYIRTFIVTVRTRIYVHYVHSPLCVLPSLEIKVPSALSSTLNNHSSFREIYDDAFVSHGSPNDSFRRPAERLSVHLRREIRRADLTCELHNCIVAGNRLPKWRIPISVVIRRKIGQSEPKSEREREGSPTNKRDRELLSDPLSETELVHENS